MKFEEALSINGNAYIKAIEFMMRSNFSEEELYQNGYVNRKIGNYYLPIKTSFQENDNKSALTLTEYHYTVYPYIKTTMSMRYPTVMHCRTAMLEDNNEINRIYFTDSFENNYKIRVHNDSNIFNFITKELFNGVYLDKENIIDLSDESQMFQFMILHPEIPDELINLATKLKKLTTINTEINYLEMRSERVICDLKISDLEKEYNINRNLNETL